MLSKVEKFLQSYAKKDVPEIKPGNTVRVHQKVKEGEKERIQIFEGLVLACKHGSGTNATITVRKVASGVGVERIFPIHATTIDKIEVTKKGKVRRAKLYYLRDARGKRAKLKKVENLIISGKIKEEAPAQNEVQSSEEPKA
ncbi:MAG: 50S ribosomal protein L19 [Candidatus Paceibacterota bacterium]|jgi:large subunit ribosomal protein L19